MKDFGTRNPYLGINAQILNNYIRHRHNILNHMLIINTKTTTSSPWKELDKYVRSRASLGHQCTGQASKRGSKPSKTRPWEAATIPSGLNQSAVGLKTYQKNPLRQPVEPFKQGRAQDDSPRLYRKNYTYQQVLLDYQYQYKPLDRHIIGTGSEPQQGEAAYKQAKKLTQGAPNNIYMLERSSLCETLTLGSSTLVTNPSKKSWQQILVATLT